MATFFITRKEVNMSSLASRSPWDGRGLVERRARLLVVHLEEEQERELLDGVSIGEPVVAQDVAVVPEFLNNALSSSIQRPRGVPRDERRDSGTAYTSKLARVFLSKRCGLSS